MCCLVTSYQLAEVVQDIFLSYDRIRQNISELRGGVMEFWFALQSVLVWLCVWSVSHLFFFLWNCIPAQHDFLLQSTFSQHVLFLHTYRQLVMWVLKIRCNIAACLNACLCRNCHLCSLSLNKVISWFLYQNCLWLCEICHLWNYFI